MPGIENFAPERHETNKRILRIAEFLASRFFDHVSMRLIPAAHIPAGNFPSFWNSLHASVVIVKNGGTGTPARVISSNPAPFPPTKPFTYPNRRP